MILRIKWAAAVGFGALVMAGGAAAQDNLGAGKTAAQLFASDCAPCHKSPQGLVKSGRLFGVSGFLREHYTASKESAAAIAAYLEAVDKAAGPAPREAARPKRTAKPTDGKPAAKKPADAKNPETKAPESKTAEPKASESKPAEPKPEAKPEAKPAEAPKAD